MTVTLKRNSMHNDYCILLHISNSVKSISLNSHFGIPAISFNDTMCIILHIFDLWNKSKYIIKIIDYI